MMERWIATIETVILVANRRDKVLSDFHGKLSGRADLSSCDEYSSLIA
jgi:hypothetical protein